jgi:hypothetical protein
VPICDSLILCHSERSRIIRKANNPLESSNPLFAFIGVMSRVEPHSRLLNEAARTVLRPIGMFQKGRSRTWLDDQGWWIGHVEFQPSGWSKGSYLNVAAMWLWHEKDYFSFDFSFDPGARVEGFIPFENEQQFALEALRLASVARDRVLEYRRVIRTCRDAANCLAHSIVQPHDYYDVAVAYACAGDTRKARKMFERLSQFRNGFRPGFDSKLGDLTAMLDDPSGFQKHIEETIHRTRTKLKLPEISNLGLC